MILPYEIYKHSLQVIFISDQLWFEMVSPITKGHAMLTEKNWYPTNVVPCVFSWKIQNKICQVYPLALQTCHPDLHWELKHSVAWQKAVCF